MQHTLTADTGKKYVFLKHNRADAASGFSGYPNANQFAMDFCLFSENACFFSAK
jgi:hypothetical protein